MRQLIWSPRARDDLIEIAACYNRIAPHVVDQMLDAIELAPTPLFDFPEIGSLTSAGPRKWRVPKTPYLLLYDISEKAVEVVTVVHDRTDWP